MNYHIKENCGKTAYIQLYEQIKKDIITGVYPYGSKLPSKRTLSDDTGISVITTQHAYAILCDEGYIEARQRSGYFVIYKESDFLSNPEIIKTNFSDIKQQNHNTKSQFPFSVMAKTMRKVLLDYGEQILMKSPNHGCHQLRSAISSYLMRSCGINVKPEQIIIGAGAEYLYSLITLLLGKDRTFAIENPSYDKIKKVYTSNGVNFEMLKMSNDGIITSELENSKATVLHITPFNSFPSGITATVSKRYEYIRWAEKRNGFIIEDNYDSELTISSKNDDTVFSLAKNSSVIYLNTFSETIAPSMRVGYMVLPYDMLNEFENKVGFYSCTVPVFEQYVLAELINNGDFERHINRTRRIRRKNRKNLVI